jgi:hypothetical protein
MPSVLRNRVFHVLLAGRAEAAAEGSNRNLVNACWLLALRPVNCIAALYRRLDLYDSIMIIVCCYQVHQFGI